MRGSDSMPRPIDSMILQGDLVHFRMADLRVSFIGLMEEEGDVISGTWRQGDAQLPLTLERRDNH